MALLLLQLPKTVQEQARTKRTSGEMPTMTLDHVNPLAPLEAVEIAIERERQEERHLVLARRELVASMKDAYGPYTLQQIGDAAGLSRERVRQLLKEEK